MHGVPPGIIVRVKALDLDGVRPGVESGANHEMVPIQPQIPVIVKVKNLRAVAVQEGPDCISNKTGGPNDDLGCFRERKCEVIRVVARINEPALRPVSITVEGDLLRVGKTAGIDHRPGTQDVGPRGLSVAGNLDPVRSRREGLPHEETQWGAGERAVIVAVNHRAVAFLEFAHGIEAAERPDENTGLFGQREREVIHVRPWVDDAFHIGA